MATYSIYDAKAKLSELLRQVKAGQHVTITERGKPIARVSPYSSLSSVEDRLQDLAARGYARVAETGPLRPHKRVRGGLKRFLKDRD